MSAIRFTKMHGIGNDYVYVDVFERSVSDPSALARRIADRHFGVGSDGLILVAPPTDEAATAGAHVRMRMFNADGSESEMCGNGVRCVCKLAHDTGRSRAHPMRVETGAGILELRYTTGPDGAVDRVTVDMGAPQIDAADVPVVPPPGTTSGRVIDVPIEDLLGPDPPPVALRGLHATAVGMGNPHVVLFVDRAGDVPLGEVGPFLERHPAFPRRVNAHFVACHGRGAVTVRTWERGSGVTLACGTGASAVCVAGVLTGRTGRRVRAHLPGGDLELEWDEATEHVFMTGSATHVFEGDWPMDGAPDTTSA